MSSIHVSLQPSRAVACGCLWSSRRTPKKFLSEESEWNRAGRENRPPPAPQARARILAIRCWQTPSNRAAGPLVVGHQASVLSGGSGAFPKVVVVIFWLLKPASTPAGWWPRKICAYISEIKLIPGFEAFAVAYRRCTAERYFSKTGRGKPSKISANRVSL